MEEQIRFQNAGQWLYGLLHLPQEPRGPGLVLLHGFFGNHIEMHRLFVSTARALAAAGLAVLRFDFRGFGDSEGDTVDMTLDGEISDARQALSYLERRHEVDPARLGVLGISLGGCVAACLAGTDPRVKALVLWSPTALLHLGEPRSVLPPEVMAQLAAQGWADRWGNRIGRAFYEGLPQVCPVERVRGYKGPALVVYGTADATVSRENPEAYLATLSGPAEYVTIEGADHVFSSHSWTSQLIETSLRWLVANL